MGTLEVGPSARVTISKFWDMLKNDKMAMITMTVITMVILTDAII